jgi:hypothetical protein
MNGKSGVGQPSVSSAGRSGKVGSGSVNSGGDGKTVDKGKAKLVTSPTNASIAPKGTGLSAKELAGRIKQLNQVVSSIGAPSRPGPNGPTPKGKAAPNSKPVLRNPQTSGTPRFGSRIIGIRAPLSSPAVIEELDEDSATPSPISGNPKMAHRLTLSPDASRKTPAVAFLSQAEGEPSYRSYYDDKGREISRARVVKDVGEFSKRLSVVKSKDFHTKAVGLASSSVYHGSESIEMDFVRNGVRGTRMAGSQYIDVVEIAFEDNFSIGERFFVVLINPVALGGRLQLAAKMYEQCKANHLKFVYKPLQPATALGGIAFYFRNDTQNPIYETGLDELMHAADRDASNFKETNVWNPESLDVQISNVNLKYWDETAGDFAEDVQGMLTCEASASIPATQGTLGHFYLEYDYEFWAAELDYETQELGVVWVTIHWNAYTSVSGAPVRLIGVADGSGLASFQISAGTALETSEFLLVGAVHYAEVTGQGGLAWCTSQDTTTHSFARGQGFYLRFSGTSGNFTNSTTSMLVFADLNSASGVVVDTADAAADGQLQYKAGAAATGSMVLRCRAIPLASGVE